jgi:hypothetical protein
MVGGGAAISGGYTGTKVGLMVNAPFAANTWVAKAEEIGGNENNSWSLSTYAVCLRVVP